MTVARARGWPWRARDTIHHSGADSRHTAVRFTETQLLEGLIPSIGTVGDAPDTALAETTIGLYKTECVRDGSPFRRRPLATLADLEDITSAWGALVQHQPAHAPPGTPPASRSRLR